MSATSLKVSRSSVSGAAAGGESNAGMAVSVILLVMALLQLISFSGLKDWLSAIGFSSPATWGVIIIAVEVIAALGFLKLALPPMAKMVSWAFAVLASGFWFVENLRLVSDGTASQLSSSGFFGKYLRQMPGWWTVIEISIFLMLTLYALGLSKDN